MNDQNDFNVVDFKRKPWNEGKSVGQKPPLQPEHVWAIRTKLQDNGRIRDLALFNLAIDSKLRGCDVVSLKVEDVAPHGCAIEQGTLQRKKSGRPVKLEITKRTCQSVDNYLRATAKVPGEFLFTGRGGKDRCLTTRQYARLVSQWIESIGLDASLYGTQSLGRTKAAKKQLRGEAGTTTKGALEADHNRSEREAAPEFRKGAGTKRPLILRALKKYKANHTERANHTEAARDAVKKPKFDYVTKTDINRLKGEAGTTPQGVSRTIHNSFGRAAGTTPQGVSRTIHNSFRRAAGTTPLGASGTDHNSSEREAGTTLNGISETNHNSTDRVAAPEFRIVAGSKMDDTEDDTKVAADSVKTPKLKDVTKADNNHKNYLKGEAVFSIRARLVVGLFVTTVLVLGGGVWAGTAQLSGAIIAQGSVVVERHVKKVQHLDGGIVAEISVVDGDVVQAGDILIKLDDTRDRAELGVVRTQIVELVGRKARLFAERDELAEMEFPSEFDTMGPGAIRVRNGEVRLFNSNRKSRESTKEQLGLRIGQHKNEIRALASQRDAKAEELKLIRKELEQVRTLYDQKLTTVTRLYQLEREATRIEGERGGLEAQIARTKNQITEVGLQILAVDQTMKRDAQREIGEIEAKIAELAERKVIIADRLSRVDLRAPVSGVVHELAVHTVGGVVTPAQPVMIIVPGNEDLTIEARILPNDIDQVGTSQRVRVRLSAFNQRATSELQGRVVHVAADVTEDARSGQNYYLARINIDKESLEEIVDWKLVPGMPVEVFMTTGERTALSYLAKPITDQLERAFRDD